jgi:hypothetical protein
MPRTRGDIKQFVIAISIALGSAVLWQLNDILGNASLRDVDWIKFGWDMADNIVQGAVTYTLAWWGFSRAHGFTRIREVETARAVRPTTEEVIAPTKEGGPV